MNDAFRGTPLQEEYGREIQRRFVDNPLCGFIEGLRNYTLHYALPIAGRQVRLDNRVGVPDLALTLNVRTTSAVVKLAREGQAILGRGDREYTNWGHRGYLFRYRSRVS